MPWHRVGDVAHWLPPAVNRGQGTLYSLCKGSVLPPESPEKDVGKHPGTFVYVGGTFKHDLETHSFCLGET